MARHVQPAVVGATGYAGFELTRILLGHPGLKKPLLLRRETEETVSLDLADMYPQLACSNGALPVESFSWKKLKDAGVDVLFLCTPHEVSRAWVPQAIDEGLRVVDLSGAWRLKCPENRAVYKFEDADPARAAQIDNTAAFGIPELHEQEIKQAKLVANAGCYATSVILALAPWVRAGLIDIEHGIISDSKSGISGAGKQPTPKTSFCEAADNLSAYSVFGHRHSGEILEQLGLKNEQLQFTPHLLPIPRGILSTIYVRLKAKTPAAELEGCFRDFYKGQPWVRIFGQKLPQIKYSVNTNYCDIGFQVAPDGYRAVIVSCLDNLVKGAAGQAAQNMNVMFGFDQREGLQ